MSKKIKLVDMGINKAIFYVAFPAICSFIFQIFFEIVDTYWLDKLNYADVFASLGSASFITWSLYSLMLIVNGGVNSLVSQESGANNKVEYVRISWNGLFLSIFFSIIIVVIMLFFQKDIFILIGLKGNILKGASDYLEIILYGYIFLFLFSCTGIIFNAHGETKVTMITGFATLFLNILIDPIFILGMGSIPKLGIKGAAIATVLSQILGLIFRFFLLFKYEYLNFLPARKIVHMKTITKILKIGIPQAATHWIFSMVYPILTIFITELNNLSALGALGICHRIEGVPYFISVSLSIAATTLVGQYSGSNNFHKVNESVNKIILYGTISMIITSFIFIFYPGFLLSSIISAPKVIEEGIVYLKIIGYFEIFLAWEIIFEGVFTGFGLTLYPMYFSIPLTLLRIPLAYYMAFSLHMGVKGIWWAISITTLMKGIGIGTLYWTKFSNFQINSKNYEMAINR